MTGIQFSYVFLVVLVLVIAPLGFFEIYMADLYGVNFIF